MYKEKGIIGLSPMVPACKDTLNAILQCITTTDICIGSDLEDNKIECWTPKDTSSIRYDNRTISSDKLFNPDNN